MTPYTRVKVWCVVGMALFVAGLWAILVHGDAAWWVTAVGVIVSTAGVMVFGVNWITYDHMRDNPWEREL